MGQIAGGVDVLGAAAHVVVDQDALGDGDLLMVDEVDVGRDPLAGDEQVGGQFVAGVETDAIAAVRRRDLGHVGVEEELDVRRALHVGPQQIGGGRIDVLREDLLRSDHAGHAQLRTGHGAGHLQADQAGAHDDDVMRAEGRIVNTARILDGAQITDICGDPGIETGNALRRGAGGDEQLVVVEVSAIVERDSLGGRVELDGRPAEVAADLLLAIEADVAEVERGLGYASAEVVGGQDRRVGAALLAGDDGDRLLSAVRADRPHGGERRGAVAEYQEAVAHIPGPRRHVRTGWGR